MSAAALLKDVITGLVKHRETLDQEHTVMATCKELINTQEKYGMAIYFREWKDPLIWEAVAHLADSRYRLDHALKFIAAARGQVDQYLAVLRIAYRDLGGQDL